MNRCGLFKSLLVLFTFTFYLLPSTTYAVVDPLSSPNNKFGIHIIQATPDEASPAASLVNSSGGDWGYITVLIESKDRNQSKWQEFFNDLRRRHLIPLIRLATKPINEYWERPYEGEEQAWANFLANLNWPTKNRYVIIYNEPNHAKEWGNSVDAKSYAKVLDKTITALKSKNGDFFVLNGGFDASTPNQLPNYQDEVSFLEEVQKEVPGIFEKLDGWVSHSYPNPAFLGSPNDIGRGTVRTYLWELSLLRNLGVKKILPIFITETGWKHAEGIDYNPAFPNSAKVSEYFAKAFEGAWNYSRVVAVTPFLLNYQDPPFDHFSFKRIQNQAAPQIQPASPSPKDPSSYYPPFQVIENLTKLKGKPTQDNLAKLTKGEIYSSIVAGENYQISLTFKNMGQSIWNDQTQIKLVPTKGGPELGIKEVELPKNIKIEPGQEYTFKLLLKAPQKGNFQISLQLFSNSEEFDSNSVEFITKVKQPVILQVLTKLKWKSSFAGDYILRVSGVVDESSQVVTLDSIGESKELEARYLLPDYAFDFTLEKPYYHPKTIHQTVKAGINILDFGILQPALLPALLHPGEFWNLLPFSP